MAVVDRVMPLLAPKPTYPPPPPMLPIAGPSARETQDRSHGARGPGGWGLRPFPVGLGHVGSSVVSIQGHWARGSDWLVTSHLL